jgi:PKD repeat protein
LGRCLRSDPVKEDPTMSDPQPAAAAAEPAKKAGWLKTLLGTAAGLFSGALMMYLSPLIDRVVKPAKPVANFAVEHNGLTVTFHNRSAGGSDGWWDFGDGSPLELVAAKQETVTHTYASPGTYAVKLTLRNLLGEENERAVTVQLDDPRTEPPTIVSLEAVPVSRDAYAPATFRVLSRAQNAELCVWDFGDDRPLEISPESPNRQDKLVTFTKSGGYMIKLAAVNGKQAVEKSTIVYVDEPPTGTVTAVLTATDQATRVETIETAVPVTEAFPPQSTAAEHKIDRQIPARQGFAITAAHFEPVSGKGGKDLRLQIAPDRRSVRLTGVLVRETGKARRGADPAGLMLRVLLTQERRTPVARPAVPVTATLGVPGAALLALPPLPADWKDPQRRLRLELRDGDRTVWQESQLPRGATATLLNRRCKLTATPLGDQVRIELVELPPGLSPAAN